MWLYFGKPTIYCMHKNRIHLLPVHDRHAVTHSCAIQKHQAPDNRLAGVLLQTAFYQCSWTARVNFMVLGCINRTAWGTKLLLMTVWASLVDCISLCHLLKAQHCSLSLNGCFSPPSASHQPTLPHPLPLTHPPPIDSIRDIKKLSQKPATFS